MAIRLALLLLALAFLSFSPSISSTKPFRVIGQNLPKSRRYTEMAKYFFKDAFKDLIKDSLEPKDQTPKAASTEEVGFYISFNVSNTPVTARMSISDIVTLLDNYQPSYSSTFQCCTQNLTCSTAICNGNSSYYQADTFIFQDGQLTNVPYEYNPGDKTQSTTGFLSFSRSSYSLLSIAQDEVFSYFFSDFTDSNVTLGFTPNATTLQSTKIITNPDYPHLYYVNLTRISIGSTIFQFNLATNSSIVILDTVMVPTLLETSVYANVTLELKKLGNSFSDPDSGLEVCYKSKNIAWPNLTLFFPSDPPSSTGAQMVLTSDSYVVKVQSGSYCAAIYESVGGSVIGILAQINREMIFNISKSGPRLQFSQYPASEAAFLTKATLNRILIWSLSALFYLHIQG